MPLKITPGDGEQRSTGRTFREVELDNGRQALAFTLWSDGTLQAEVIDYVHRNYEDDEPFSTDKDDTPDAIMAIQEFLGSL